MYKCYYCGIKESSLQSIIEHCKLSHGEETLKYQFEKDSYRSSPLLEYSASFFWIPYQV
jgi:hypothetical protein